MAKTNSYSNTVILNSPNSPGQAAYAANLTFYPTDNHNLPFALPHVDADLVYAAPPVDDSQLSTYNTQNNYSPVGVLALSLKVLGTAITLGTFPQAQRVASASFVSNSGLLSVDLIAAIVNPSTDGEVGIFVAKDVGPTIGLATSSDVYDGILCPGGAAPAGIFSKRSGASFSLDIAPLIKQGTSVALYAVAYGTNKATATIAVSCILRYANLDG